MPFSPEELNILLPPGSHQPLAFTAPDGQELTGYLRLPDAANTVVIRWHGLAGSAFGNTHLVAAESYTYATHGIGFMPVDGSGTEAQSETEVFSDSMLKIQAAIGAIALHCPNVQHIALEGFSLGASKVAAYVLNSELMESSALPVAAAMLMSWTNVPTWMRSQEHFAEVYQAAHEAVRAGRGAERIVDRFSVFDLPFTAEAFLSLVEGAVDIYPRRAGISIPTISIFASGDSHLVTGLRNVGAYYDILRHTPNIHARQIMMGDHAFEGIEISAAVTAAGHVCLAVGSPHPLIHETYQRIRDGY